MNAMRATSFPPTVSGDGLAVLDACHRKTLAMLEDLSMLVVQLERRRPDASMSARAAKIAAYFSTTAREHHEDEERHVFPALVALGKPDIVRAVLQLQQDHDWLEEDWFDLAPQVQALAAGRPVDIDAMRESVAMLTTLYHDHIGLEESCLYPEARKYMLPGARCEMGREMAARHRAERAARRQTDSNIAMGPRGHSETQMSR
jgi:hemerythrin-like domain-containing protein